MHNDPSHIDDLIAKYLAGEILPEEEQLLMQWIEASPENKKYFGDIQFVHNRAVASHKYVKVDTNKAWEKLHSQMKRQPVVKTPIVAEMPVYKQLWFRVAASVVILAGLFSIIYNYWPAQGGSPQTIVIASNDSTLSRTISGSTKVVLNKQSKIIYNQKPGKKEVEVTLTGEAFIEVEHSKDTAFIVKAEETFIRDIGTSFNVKAYPASSTIEVYVESGEIAFYTEQSEGISIKAGETGIYNKETKQFSKAEVQNLNVVSYKTRIFFFSHTRLADVVNELNAVYPEVVTISNPKLADCTINVTFDNEPIQAVVNIIAETLGLQVTETGNGFILGGDHCLTP